MEVGRNRVQEVIPVKRKTPYSLLDVKCVSIGAIVPDRKGQRCLVGVDVSKHELAACAYWPDRTFERPWRVRSPGEIGLLVSKLQELSLNGAVVVAMESSGTYGDVLRQALGDAGIEVQRVSSKATKDHAETFDGVASQHDGKDAAVIAELCWLGKGRGWSWSSRSQADQALGYWVRRLDTAQRIKQVYCGKLEALLARHWPEAGGLVASSGPTLTGALARWGDPRRLGGDGQAARVLKGLGGHYLREAKIAALIEAARTTIGVRMDDWQIAEMQDVAQAIIERRGEIGRCKRALRKLAGQLPVIVAQTPVVGLVTACVLWMCLGDVWQYDSAGAYRKAMGLNLKERSSGMYKGKLRISKRGQRLPRKWLYFAALRWAREPAVKVWMRRKKQRDNGRGGKAVVAVMRRLALAAYHVGRGEGVFDAGRLFPGLPRGLREASVR